MPVLRFLPVVLVAAVIPAVVPASAWAESVTLGSSGLSLPVPESWHVDRTVPGTVAVLRSPVPDDVAAASADAQARACGSIAIVVAPLRPDETQGAFTQRAIGDLDSMLTDYDPHDHDFAKLIGGREFQFLAYHFRTGQIVWEQEMYITANKGQAVVVTCGCDIAHFEHWKAAMAACVEALGKAGR
jgi:hypothetical protein